MSHCREKLQYINDVLEMAGNLNDPIERVFYFNILNDLLLEYFECDYPTAEFNLDLQKDVNKSLDKFFVALTTLAYETLDQIQARYEIGLIMHPQDESMLDQLSGNEPSAVSVMLNGIASGETYCCLQDRCYLADSLLHYDPLLGGRNIYLLNMSHLSEPSINLVRVFRKRKKSILTSIVEIRDYYKRQPYEEHSTVCLQSSDQVNKIMAIKKITIDLVLFTPWKKLHKSLVNLCNISSESFIREKTSLNITPKEDHLLNFPFYSYDSLVMFMKSLLTDGGIEEIVWTVYRVVDNGVMFEIFNQILECNIKLTLVIEVRAKYEELNNIDLVRHFEDAGARICISHVDNKHHAKWSLIKFVDPDRQDIAMIGTGNWNESHAKKYNDLLLITRSPSVVADLDSLFKVLLDKNKVDDVVLQSLWISKINLEECLYDKIHDLINKAHAGLSVSIFIKTNDLTYGPLIDKLKQAAQCGVKIELCIRRVVTIYTQENIQVYRYLGSMLEHSRIICFEVEGCDPDIYIGSGNMNAANFLRRYEVYVPVYNQRIKDIIVNLVSKYKDKRFARIVLHGLYQRQLIGGESLHEWMLDNYKELK